MGAYRIELTPDDNGTLLVTSADFPELTTFGEDETDAGLRASMAIEEAIAARIAAGDDLPIPSGFVTVGKPYVLLRAQTELKVSLYRTLRQLGVTRAELARRLGWHREQVDRLFRLDHASRLDQIEAAFEALGFRLDLSNALSRTDAA